MLTLYVNVEKKNMQPLKILKISNKTRYKEIRTIPCQRKIFLSNVCKIDDEVVFGKQHQTYDQ